MPLYLCRWPNGDCSFVEASNKKAAIATLHEAGNAEGCSITPMQDFMVHFALSNGGKLDLQCFGEATEEAIFEIAYPVLGKALVDAPEEANTGVLTPEGESLIQEAVRKERERVREKRAKEPQTELDRNIKPKTDVPTRLIDRAIRKGAEKTVKKSRPGGKPN